MGNNEKLGSVMDSLPKVSVYISTFNRLDRLKRAISSVKGQDYHNIELIVCDDASTDGTQSFMEDLAKKDPNIIYLRNEENKGACATRNLGIFKASGDFITGLDDDDEFTSDRISFLVKNWDCKYSFICCDFIEEFIDGKRKNFYNKSKDTYFNDYRSILFENEASNQIFTLSARLKEIGGFNPEVKRLQDWDTWLRLANKYGGFLRKKEAKYIMHHDHAINEERVSKSYPYSHSLTDLLRRNESLYLGKDREFMLFLIEMSEKKASLSSAAYWSLIKLNPKFIVKKLINR
ncbi:glycosyltransferase [Serratia quinivorans]|uniref:glycosyltransferase n=1 Tax=Serratia quinivorans TaxID=137545 RepID=UPI00217A5B01|nr:glycosyltransferase [Serratia quinivorans]CAI0883112.1 Chondroitin polymerase [Serratia quinivorans]CAI0905244.1 Chondroitin polymerase [Serratia quinivorans]CAI0931782.1 Chondroitin polymerase [Serratia quinivorans]CAI1524093.1 Chondroitin polymerase [Serratia quinivorans]CAI2060541.1 Chondroitin polymerase [Serratia quinivorans]